MISETSNVACLLVPDVLCLSISETTGDFCTKRSLEFTQNVEKKKKKTTFEWQFSGWKWLVY